MLGLISIIGMQLEKWLITFKQELLVKQILIHCILKLEKLVSFVMAFITECQSS